MNDHDTRLEAALEFMREHEVPTANEFVEVVARFGADVASEAADIIAIQNERGHIILDRMDMTGSFIKGSPQHKWMLTRGWTERDAHAMHILCNACGHRYTIEPATWIEDSAHPHGYYSSRADFCIKCESSNLTRYLHGEDVDD